MKNDLSRARVPSDPETVQREGTQPFGFMRSHTPVEYCRQVGLNWMSAIDLHRQKLLSFDPKTTQTLTASQEAELRFLGHLVTAGCCGHVLGSLLADLKKPYAYNLERMYFDFETRQWRLLEDTEHIEARFEDWLRELVAWSDLSVLERIQLLVDDAVLQLRARQQPAVMTNQADAFLKSRGVVEGRPSPRRQA